MNQENTFKKNSLNSRSKYGYRCNTHKLLITLLAEENASANFKHLCPSVLNHVAGESDEVCPEYAPGL